MRARLLWSSLLMLTLSALFGCGGDSVRPANQAPISRPVAQAPAPRYEVQRGDTLYAIARRNSLDFRQLAQLNGIAPPYTIYPGQSLRLAADPPRQPTATPTAPQTGAVRGVAALSDTAPASVTPITTTTRPEPAKPIAQPSASAGSPAATASASTTTVPNSATAVPASSAPSNAAVSKDGWQWPTEGGVLRTFHANDPARQGIKIGGQAGQPVRASRGGQVVYSGTGLVGYGELIIVKHDGGYLTAYGHNRKRLVQEGDQVKAGQVIAELGRSGTDREMLHFEIRFGGKPTDPLRLLPPR